jgi:TonB-linked SusC/RagA family outer membrane protein
MYDYQPYEGVYLVDSNGNPLLDSNGNPIYNLTSSGFSISEALINNPEDEYNTFLIGGLYAKADFTDHISNEFRVGATNTRFRREYFLKPGSVLDGYVGDANNPGSKTDNGSNTLDYTVTNLLSYNRTIADKHDFTLTGLFEFNKSTFRNYSLTSSGYGSTGGLLSVQSVGTLPTATSTNLIENTLLSYGGFLDYSYDDKYLMTASIRRDASSTFGINKRYGVFWSASAAWNITKESFMENGFLDDLKIRGSAGSSGNRSGVGSYQSLALIGFGSLGGLPTATPTDNGNPNLGFEKNFIWDAGVEFTMFDRRLRGVVDYYERTTSDLLLNVDLLRLGGEPDGSILSNVGEMVNKGVEVELTADIFKTEDFQLTIGGNIAFVDNEVTKLEPSADDPEGAPIDRSLSTIRIGEEINTYYMPLWAGVNPANGQPLFYDSDGNITNVYDSDANVVLSGKSPLADFDGGANIYLNYKGFDLGMDFYYKFGHYIYNFMESNMLSDGTGINANQRVDAFNYWKNPGDVNVLPSPLYGNDAQQFTDRFLQKGDYVRLRNLTLGYNLPRKFTEAANIKSLRIYIQGQNLWTWVKEFKGDPEVGIGSGESANPVFGEFNLYSYPQTQSLSLGVDLKF